MGVWPGGQKNIPGGEGVCGGGRTSQKFLETNLFRLYASLRIYSLHMGGVVFYSLFQLRVNVKCQIRQCCKTQVHMIRKSMQFLKNYIKP